MGHTLTLNLPDDVFQSLMKKAEQADLPPETVAAQLLATAAQHDTEDPLEAFIGAFSSDGSKWADDHDAHLGNAARDGMRVEGNEGHPNA